jgi:hypothetical protein
MCMQETLVLNFKTAILALAAAAALFGAAVVGVPSSKDDGHDQAPYAYYRK